MNLQATHARALAKVRKTGQAVTFTLVSPGTHVPSTGGFTAPTTTSVAGYAIQVKGEGGGPNAAFQDGETVEVKPLTLFFVPSTFGSVPPLGSTATWAGTTHRVKKTRSIAPAGTAIASYVTFD